MVSESVRICLVSVTTFPEVQPRYWTTAAQSCWVVGAFVRTIFPEVQPRYGTIAAQSCWVVGAFVR